MFDFVYVNILNEGPLPWIRKSGPLFGYKIGYGMYQIISKDPRIKIEIVNSTSEIEAARKKYLEEKENAKKASELKTPIILHDDVKITDNVQVLTEKVEVKEDTVAENISDDIDSQMDLLLEVMGETPEEPTTYVPSEKITTSDVKERTVYSEDELSVMTKSAMKNILKERGYTSGPYSPKYHDTVEILIRKVLSTQ